MSHPGISTATGSQCQAIVKGALCGKRAAVVTRKQWDEVHTMTLVFCARHGRQPSLPGWSTEKITRGKR